MVSPALIASGYFALSLSAVGPSVSALLQSPPHYVAQSDRLETLQPLCTRSSVDNIARCPRSEISDSPAFLSDNLC